MQRARAMRRALRESPRRRQISLRVSLLATSYLVLAADVALVFWRRSGGFMAYSSTTSNGHPITTSIYDVNPRPVGVILSIMAVAVIVASWSVLHRIRRRSASLGVAGVAAAALVSLITVAGALSIGMFAAPLAALLIILALPMETLRPSAS